MTVAWQPQFVFAACQHGAEAALKRELAVRAPELRPAFSRPGSSRSSCRRRASKPEQFALPSAFARDLRLLARLRAGRPSARSRRAACGTARRRRCRSPRATSPVCTSGSATLRCPASATSNRAPRRSPSRPSKRLRRSSPLESLRDSATPARVSPRNRWVLDVGARRAGPVVRRLPSHRQPHRMLARRRAAARAARARRLARVSQDGRGAGVVGLPMSRGEHVVELGCAPGGASQALLDAGLFVTGVDPGRSRRSGARAIRASTMCAPARPRRPSGCSAAPTGWRPT